MINVFKTSVKGSLYVTPVKQGVPGVNITVIENGLGDPSSYSR